jgi:glycosyltransferase involved in cell wall biosynthesis
MKNKYPLVSVVMLNYNGLQYLKKTISPILKLDYPNYEFIIVDNGSIDGSIEFVKKNKKIKLIHSPRLRQKNFACNYAIDKANGKFILLLDNDCEICEKDLLINLLKMYQSLCKVGAICLSFFNSGESVSQGYGGFINRIYFITNNRSLKKSVIKKLHKIEIVVPHGLGFFIKKSVWREVLGYDDYLAFGGDDTDLGLKLSIFGYKNYLYAKKLQKHIGMKERQDDFKYALKFQQMFYGHLYPIVKNCRFFTILTSSFGFFIYSFFKSVKQSIMRRNIRPSLSFFIGYYLFLKNLPIALKKRKFIQSKRVIKQDLFIKIKRPNLY